jgi:hypothetical protein
MYKIEINIAEWEFGDDSVTIETDDFEKIAIIQEFIEFQQLHGWCVDYDVTEEFAYNQCEEDEIAEDEESEEFEIGEIVEDEDEKAQTLVPLTDDQLAEFKDHMQDIRVGKEWLQQN